MSPANDPRHQPQPEFPPGPSSISSYHQLDYGSHLVDETRADQLVSMTRRRLLQGVAATGAAGIAGWQYLKTTPVGEEAASLAGVVVPSGDDAPSGPVLQVGEATGLAEPIEESALITLAPVDQRVLVLIELEGGNDGQSTVVPYASGRFHDLRGDMAPDAGSVFAIDDEVGLSPHLGLLAQRQFATVEGVGPVDGVLSHFEMVERWSMGDMGGSGSTRAGFLARLADAVDVGATATGLSVDGYTPRFNEAAASVLSLDRPNQVRILVKNDWIFPAYRKTMPSIGGGPIANRLSQSWSELFRIGRAIGPLADADGKDLPMVKEGRGLGRQLLMAAAAIQSDLGVRVVHARMGGFDTHDGHAGRHERLMKELNAAVGGFLELIDAAGMSDRVLVATSSEFGRRARANGSGLDHGAASNMLLFGPVAPGRYGDPSPLDSLDGNDNFKTTIPFDRYLATLAQDWLGVDSGRVLGGAPAPLGLFQA